jgi:signal transduction histidine kinase
MFSLIDISGRVPACSVCCGTGAAMSSERGSDGPSERELRTEQEFRLAERNRIARELHDGTSQLLVALQLQLSHLRRSGLEGGTTLIDECEGTIREIREQIRALRGERPSSP